MKKSKNPIDDLKDQIAALESTLAENAERSLVLANERNALIRDGASDETLDAKDAEIVEFEKQTGRCRDRLNALREKLLNAEAEAAEAAQADLIQRANAATIAAMNEARNFWRDAVPKLRSVIRKIAEADALIEAANKRRAPGDALPMVERRMRCRPAVKGHTVTEKRTKIWCFAETGNRVSNDRLEFIHEVTPTTGKLHTPGLGAPKNIELREFVERHSVPAKPGTGYLKPLVAALSFPALVDGQPAGWTPLDASASPAAILRALDELEAAPAAEDRKEIVELVPLETALAAELDDFDDQELDDAAA